VIEHVYEVSNYNHGYFKERVLVITNEAIMLIEKSRKLNVRVPLRQIKGIMFYFYDERHKMIILELSEGRIVKINTAMPETNKKVLQDLKVKLE
jgi:hypothetical protein